MLNTTLLNRYRLDAELGHGGMGVVYRAYDTLLNRTVAVKVLSEASIESGGHVRLLREARAAAQLNHPNIVSVYDAGEADHAPFIVMELVEGQTLYEAPPRALPDTLFIARQICAALEHAHAHGVVHRDLKPENVVFTPDGTIKLMDFGLARSATASRLTSEGAILGTVFYVAPEQAQGREADGRADLYALGVMLYEMTTGSLPFDGDPLTVLTHHIQSPPAPPRTLRPDLPAALEAVILKLLAKNPDDRFASAREVAAALADVAEGRPTTVVMVSAPPPRHNLPIHLTSFIGREKEMAEVKRLLSASRLLTLTGSGGTGKTRLSLHAAADLLDTFSDGVWLVELASLSDPALVPQTVAATLNVREEPGRPIVAALVDYLRARHLLLLLDNCEHLIEACAQLAHTLLHACPDLRIMASSREALGIAGETTFRVPSLSLPSLGPRQRPTAETLIPYEAIRLFVERAQAARPDFEMTDANASPIALICRRLDGVPLAIELAAARIRAMSVEQIAARLDDRFRLLTGGSRTALPRQQTLRALIDWSWDLLTESERTLLRRLSVFWDGWTLEAAEVVCCDKDEGRRMKDEPALQPSAFILHPSDILDLLTRLVDKSLVVAEEQEGEERYQLQETIRQYARERLLEAGPAEAERVRGRHLSFFVRLAGEAEPELRRGDQLAWLAQLETEHGNLRAALQWALGSRETEKGLRLAADLSRFWYLRGYWKEGREWLEQMLAEASAETTPPEASARLRLARARALYGMAWLMDEDGRDIPLYEESIALCRKLGDKWGAAFSLRGLGATTSYRGNPEQGTPLLEESLALFREVDDPWGMALVLFSWGWVVAGQDDLQKAQAMWDESLSLFRNTGDRWGIAVVLGGLGYIARLLGHYPKAAALSEESLTLFRELGDKAGVAVSLSRLGNVALRRGDYPQAVTLLEEGLALQRERGDRAGAVFSLSLLGTVACYQGRYEHAASLLDESLAISRETEDEVNAAYALTYLGLAAYYAGDLERAGALWREAVAAHRENEERLGLGVALNGLGLIAMREGDLRLAANLLDESLALHRAVGDRRYIAIALDSQGRLACAQGDAARAASLFRESLILRKKMGDKQGLAEALEALASVPSIPPGRAARLLGAAEALRAAIGAPIPPVERADYDRAATGVRTQMNEGDFAAAWGEGIEMTPEQAISYALKESTP
jgi:non-specific serine/threonine protein kinase